MSINILRLPATVSRNGYSRATIYNQITQGTFTPGVNLGLRAVGWPEYEVNAVTTARIAGCSDDEIRTLVKWLIDFRDVVACKSDDEIRAEVGSFIASLKRAA